ncbi:MAG: hypothetical protein M3Z25_23650 [Actinomycetota bacterium]|nr:hypothetical protein [Actinomycetota bacterium]
MSWAEVGRAFGDIFLHGLPPSNRTDIDCTKKVIDSLSHDGQNGGILAQPSDKE